MTNDRNGSHAAAVLWRLLWLVGLTLPHTASSAYLDTIVQCDATLSYACATRLFASSFPCPPVMPSNNTNMNTTTSMNTTTTMNHSLSSPSPAPSATCVDIEEHTVNYAFTTGLTNGTDTHGNASMGYNGFFTTLSWFGINETCVATVNGTQCASCAICNTTENLFSVDCTNLASGVTTNCTSIAPVFYPLDASFPYPNTTMHTGGGSGGNMTTTMAPSMAATTNMTTTNATTTMTPTSSLNPTLAPSNMTTSSMVPTSTNLTMMPTTMNHSIMPTSSQVNSSTTHMPTASPIGTSTLTPTKKPPSTSGAIANAAMRWITTVMVGTMLTTLSSW